MRNNRILKLSFGVAACLILAACVSPFDPSVIGKPVRPTSASSAASAPTAVKVAQVATTAPAAAAVSPTSSVATTSTTKIEGPVLGTLEVKGIDIGFTPNNLTVDAPGRYTIKFINTGSIMHDLTLPDGTKLVANAGETKTADVMVPAGGITFICSIPGHKDAGMIGTIAVKGSTVGANEGGDHGGPAVALDVKPDANAPAYTLHNPAAPALLTGTVHDIDLVIEEKLMTVAKGFVQKVWTFGGTVPGPVMRVKVGDTVRIHLKNPKTSQLPHSVDFHSSMVAWNDEMTSINPGEEKLYEYKAEFAGVWMYHCGTAPALHHIANGMYGMMIVEPKEGLPPVDKEFTIVQSEYYLGPQGEPASLTKANSATPAPDYVVFNGIADQYKDNPIQVDTGKRVRAFVLNAGPSIDSSFHIVGTIFDTVVKEGVRLTPDNPGHYGSQAVDLAPAQGGYVEFILAEDGLYPIVTHAFNFVGRGALGLFKAGDGDPKK